MSFGFSLAGQFRRSYDGHWPAQALSARFEQLAVDLALATYRRVWRRTASAAEITPHLARLCPIVEPSALSDPPPPVTAIILNRQGASMLDELLTSIYRINRYPTLDLIVVDHGSTDDSVAVAEKWAEILPLTLVRCARNHSFSVSCNRAAERATGEYLLLLNNDIVLSEDLVGRMVAAAATYRGMVGCKLVGLDRHDIQHIGVRFNWNLQRRIVGPHEATPLAGDERIAVEPTAFLAVTAAISLCHRDDYLGAGGLNEEYFYGFEDVDLNLKFALRRGRKNVCLNDLSAIHRGGATRLTRISRAQRSDTLDKNLAVLNRRFGYAARRTILPELFSDDGSLWGRRAKVAFVDNSAKTIAPVMAALGRTRGWQINDARGYGIKGVALLVVANPRYRLTRVRHRHPMMFRVAWILGDGAAWGGVDLSLYDLVLVADGGSTELPPPRHELPVRFLAPTAPRAADAFFAAVLETVSARHRIAIDIPRDEPDGQAAGLAAAFRAEGHFVRIDGPAQWRCRDAMRDDIAILMPGMKLSPAASDKIVVALDDAAPGAAIDLRLPSRALPALANVILDAAWSLHARRMVGPSDLPLPARAPFEAKVVAGWD